MIEKRYNVTIERGQCYSVGSVSMVTIRVTLCVAKVTYLSVGLIDTGDEYSEVSCFVLP